LSGPEVFPTRTRAARVIKRPSARRLALSFRVRTDPAVATAAATALLGLRSPSALSALEARSTPVCLAGHLPSSGFRTLLTVCFFQNLPALFHAGNALGVFPSGLFPLTEPSHPLGCPCLRGVSRALRRCNQVNLRAAALIAEPRLQGVAPCEDSTSARLDLSSPEDRCPPGFLPSRGFLRDAARSLHAGSPRELRMSLRPRARAFRCSSGC